MSITTLLKNKSNFINLAIINILVLVFIELSRYHSMGASSYANVFINSIASMLISTSFIYILLIINNSIFKKSFIKTKIAILCSISALFFLIVFAESICFYITNNTFDVAFWNLLSPSFVFESSLAQPIVSILTIWFLAIIIFCTYKLLKNYKFTKLENTIKPIMLAICLIITINVSSLKGFLSALAEYQLSYVSRSIEYKESLIPLEKLKVSPIENPKNIIHILLESFPDEFTNNQLYPNLTPNLNKLKESAIVLDNMQQIPYAKYTEAGVILSTLGRSHLSKTPEHDLSIAYLLNKAGYNTATLRGARQAAGGAKMYDLHSEKNGFNILVNKKTLTQTNSRRSSSNWGFQDSILFNQAIKTIDQLAALNKPFYMSILTLDTHLGQKQSKECESINYSGRNSSYDIVQSAKCTDYLIGKLLKHLEDKKLADNTIIIIHSDHMPRNLGRILTNQNKQLGIIYNAKKGFVQTKPTYLSDIPETIKSILNIKTNAKFLLGEDISKEFTRQIKSEPSINEINKRPVLNSDDFNIYRSIINYYNYEV